MGSERLKVTFFSSFHPAMISYNIITGDTMSKVFQRIPGGMLIYIIVIAQ